MWSSVLQMSRVGINGIVFLILVRWLPIREVGFFGTSMSIVAFAQIFVRLGVLETYIREKEPTKEFKNTCFWISCCIGIVAALMIASVGSVYILFTDASRQGMFMLALATVPLFESFGIVPEAMLRRNLTFKTLAKRTFVATSISGFIAISLGALGFEGWSLIGFTVISSLLSSILALSMCGWWPTGWLTPKAVRAIVTPAFQITSAGFASASIVPTTQIVVAVIAGPAAAGAYTIAQRFLGLANSFVIEPARQVALPILAGLNDKPSARTAAICEAVSFLTTVTTPIYLGMFAISDQLLQLLVGANGRAATPIFEGLSWTFAPVVISMLIGQLLTAIGRPREVLKFTIVQAGVNVVVSALVAWLIVDQTGVAFALRAYALMPIVFWQAWRHAEVPPLPILKAALPPLPAGLLMIFAIYCVEHWILPDRLEPGLSTLAAQIMVGAVSYPVVLRLIAPRHFKKSFASVTSLLKRGRPTASAARQR